MQPKRPQEWEREGRRRRRLPPRKQRQRAHSLIPKCNRLRRQKGHRSKRMREMLLLLLSLLLQRLRRLRRLSLRAAWRLPEHLTHLPHRGPSLRSSFYPRASLTWGSTLSARQLER